MTQKLRLVTTAAGLVMILSGAALAVAQVAQQPTVKEGAIAQQPTVVQQAPVATVGPVSRPGKFGALGVQDSPFVLLTADECTGLGGTVNDSKTCASGKRCYTAGSDGVIRSKCIDDKVN